MSKSKKNIVRMGSIAIGIAMLFIACFKPIEVEEAILPVEKMEDVLKDIHVAEALLTEVKNSKSKDSLARIYYGQIFRIHEVNQEEFDKSMNAYFTNPVGLDSLYRDILTKIGAERNSFAKPSSK